MLFLKSPYGYNNGTGVKFKFNHFENEILPYEKFQFLLLGFSCYPPAVNKMYHSIKYSGEYTCYLQAAWFKDQYYFLEILLKTYNIELDVFFFVSEKDKKEVIDKYKYNKDKNKINEKYLKELESKYIKTGKEYLDYLIKNNRV